MSAPEMLTTKQAAARLGLTPGRICQMIHAGELKSQKLGRDHVIDASDLPSLLPRPKRGPKAAG